jgi:hypothetical protein
VKEHLHVSAIEDTAKTGLGIRLEFHVRETLGGVETSQVPKIKFDGFKNINDLLIAEAKLSSHAASQTLNK